MRDARRPAGGPRWARHCCGLGERIPPGAGKSLAPGQLGPARAQEAEFASAGAEQGPRDFWSPTEETEPGAPLSKTLPGSRTSMATLLGARGSLNTKDIFQLENVCMYVRCTLYVITCN